MRSFRGQQPVILMARRCLPQRAGDQIVAEQVLQQARRSSSASDFVQNPGLVVTRAAISVVFSSPRCGAAGVDEGADDHGENLAGNKAPGWV